MRAGDTLRTSAGVVGIESVTRVDPSTITDDDAVSAGAASVSAMLSRLGGPAEQVEQIRTRLTRLDARSTHGAWTHDVLRLVAAHPGRRARELAAEQSRETQAFKLDVRKLKELGLSHSLDVGYQISPRGAAYLEAIDELG